MDITSYRYCHLCPRSCGADRTAGKAGYCGETAELRIASASLHRGEEPPITGTGGSGTIFVSGCNLGCVFCQNFQISRQAMGKPVSESEFAGICLVLQEKGAGNINIVTGSHAAPALAAGIDLAREKGLGIPVLWNSSGYDGVESLAILKDRIDVYLPDLKTLDSGIAKRFFNAPDYAEHAAAAIKKMMEYRELKYDGERLVSGVMVRHLALPGCLEATREVLGWFAEHCKGRALLSLMTQYTPVGSGKNIPDRYVSETEYETMLGWLEEFGIEDGFCQELAAGSEWLPDFNKSNPFSSELSSPVWHWQDKF
ncbi:radical SAM protein [Leadbettera azotonutricia]|uniref:Radical SAM domain protein n=1 Tax=Leadbettera azotonutricia (strain ATCC BAA-888 / DSM 13862 / ZAS-9) TaxID=545695 RepID=F5Y7G7_LEAAZ|nr:radical SAM protein [Leadbettera azotonutricia]AEF82853.1 radical SAM domain protein [Leadbettera azotonutricia ZAS-9]